MPVATIVNADRRLDLAYVDAGEGPVVLLVHGFASSKEVNWVATGWVKAFVAAGLRVIAYDNRGHGASTKFYDEADYALETMAGDAVALLDRLGIARAHIVGYSMGARISATVAVHHGDRLGRVVLSGGGWSMVEGSGDWTPVRDGLLAASIDEVTDPRARMFRAFAEQTRSDRRALAACVVGVRQRLDPDELRRIANPVLVAVGTEDEVAGSGERLAELFAHGRFLPIPRRDHMKAVGDRVHIAGVIDFLRS
ncbi:MAG: hydrolase [Alphaproteobacteria bacterium]|nr:MAG: hydrolase [Alphaproteobacteria bacterium]